MLGICTAGGCDDSESADLGAYGTRVIPLTVEDGRTGVLVTPSIVAQSAVLIRDNRTRALLAAIVDDDFAETPRGQALLEEISGGGVEPSVFLTTDLTGVRDVGGVLDGEIPPEAWSVSVYGSDASGHAVDGISLEQERVMLEGFELDELDSYEVLRQNDSTWSTRSRRSCCCRCGGQSCGCVTCNGAQCFCNCVSCTASCDIVIGN